MQYKNSDKSIKAVKADNYMESHALSEFVPQR